MGFTPPKTIYRLDFADTDLDGLEVRMRGGRLAQAFDVAGLIGVTEANATAEDVQAMLGQYAEIADHLVSWNYEDEDGEAIPPDLEGLKTLEIRYVQMIAEAWRNAQVNVPGPLSRSSNSMPPPELSSIPMEPLVAPLAS
jgi:hypothetical protein